MRVRQVVVVVATLIAAYLPVHAMQAQATGPVQVALLPTPLGAANGFADATASAIVEKQEGWLTVTFKLPAGYKIPDKTVFEGWITDAGALSSPANSATTLDQKYGPRYGSRTISTMMDAIPYWLTAGQLVDDGKGNLTTAMKWPNYNFGAYDMVAISIETDGNVRPWDPRPGSTIMLGQIANSQPTGEVDIDKLMGPMPDMSVGQGIVLKLAKTGEMAGLKGATGKAFVLTEGAAAEIDVKLPASAKLPQGAVLEGWVVDGGLLGPFGPSHAHLADNKLGPAYNNAYYSAIADAIPFPTSLGVLKAGDNGQYSLQVHWLKYAFRVYDIVVITLEADGDQGTWNPRPGTPVLIGAISSDTDIAPLLAAVPGADDMAPLSQMGRLMPTAAATQAPTAAK